ncbi:MAG: redoxin domain-containing protein [Pseudolysinimonas sp.]
MGNTGVEVGAVAPDFQLPGLRLFGEFVERAPYRLSEHRGHPLVLAFYPLDASITCTRQLCEYANEFEGFESLGADLWAISMQDLNTHQGLARKNGLTFPLLADTRHGVADQFGVTMLDGHAIRRSVFIIDGDGVVRWKHVAMLGLGYRGAQEIRQKLLELFPAPAGQTFDLPAPV